jgi:type I restriction enzyme M protein
MQGLVQPILFFYKTGTGGTDKVWFYDMQTDGYTLE